MKITPAMKPIQRNLPLTSPNRAPLPSALFEIDFTADKIFAPPGLASLLGILIFFLVSFGSVISILCLL